MEIKSSVSKKIRLKRFLWLLVPAALLVFFLVWSVSQLSTVSVKLAWHRSPNPAVTSYKIYYSKSIWEQAIVVVAGNRTE